MATWQPNLNEQAPALVWVVLSHLWRKYFTSDPLCWIERFRPEEHSVVLYPPNITVTFSNDCSDLWGYKWFILVCLFKLCYSHAAFFLSIMFQGKHLWKHYSTTWLVWTEVSPEWRESCWKACCNTVWLLLLPEETTSALRYPNLPLWWAFYVFFFFFGF